MWVAEGTDPNLAHTGTGSKAETVVSLLFLFCGLLYVEPRTLCMLGKSCGFF